MRRLIPPHEMRLGERAVIVPQKPDIIRGKGLPAFESDGQEVVLSDYHHDLAKRGAIHVYAIEPVPPPQDEEPQP